jgi:RecA-family ATPase
VFISDVENIACKYGVSLLFVNHPVKGSSIEPSTGSMSGGAAWERFVPTIVWLEYHEKKTKPVNLVGECFAVDTEFNRTIHLSKTRYGSGQGICLAANFDNLSMKIEGIIQKGKKKNED